eukprot:gene585-81_t
MMSNKRIVVALVGALWKYAVGVLVQADDTKESSSEPAVNNGNQEVCFSDISSESSAPPMCQLFPSDKLMNVRDGVSAVSSESSAPPMCQPLPSGKLMNVRDSVSDFSSESNRPQINRLVQETDSENLKKYGQIILDGKKRELEKAKKELEEAKMRVQIIEREIEHFDVKAALKIPLATYLGIGSDVELIGCEEKEMNSLSGIITEGPVVEQGIERFFIEIHITSQVSKLSKAVQSQVLGGEKLHIKKENLRPLVTISMFSFRYPSRQPDGHIDIGNRFKHLVVRFMLCFATADGCAPYMKRHDPWRVFKIFAVAQSNRLVLKVLRCRRRKFFGLVKNHAGFMESVAI